MELRDSELELIPVVLETANRDVLLVTGSSAELEDASQDDETSGWLEEDCRDELSSHELEDTPDQEVPLEEDEGGDGSRTRTLANARSVAPSESSASTNNQYTPAVVNCLLKADE